MSLNGTISNVTGLSGGFGASNGSVPYARTGIFNSSTVYSGSGIYGGSDDPCILGYTNGTYPNGTLGKGNWERYGVYMPSSAEKAACQAPNDPWLWSVKYGWWTTYFILAGVGAVGIVNGIKRLHNLNRIMGLPSVVHFPPKLSALFRMGSYPQSGVLQSAIPPLGPFVFLFGFLVYSTFVCFLRRPYYRPPHYGGSPLGIRAEWVATAMAPWLYATATKRNFLVFFTGVSFKRIMDFHKWAPWICLFMSTVHAWSMIIRIKRQQPWHYTITHNNLYWNGFPALLALGWLCVMSLGPIRARFYESFFIMHMVAATVFLVWMYIHLANVLQSWQYMHVATVIWAAGILWRLLAYGFDHGWFSRIPRATIEALPADAIRVRIPVQNSRTWSAGSYVYLRFPSIKPWQSHPFTIASLPAPAHDLTGAEKMISQTNEMVFVLRPRDGMTARLKTLANIKSVPQVRACLIDGPYGGFMDSLRACDTVIIIAGGTGLAALISIAQSLNRAGLSRGMSCCSAVELHWAVKESACLEWFETQLNEITGANVYITNENPTKSVDESETVGNENPSSSADDGEAIINEKPQNPVDEGGIKTQAEERTKTPMSLLHTNYHRPNIGLILQDAVARYPGRTGVIVCGPTSMVLEVRNSVARLQKSILFSEKNVQCSELELYQESFDD